MFDKPFGVTIKNPETGKESTIQIKEFIPTKGRGQGRPKLIPDNLSTMKTQDLIDIWGEQKVLKVLVLPRLKQLLSTFTTEATTKEDGETPETNTAIVQADFTEMLEKLSIRGQTLAEIDDRIDEIQEGGELEKAINEGDVALAKQLMLEVKELRKDRAAKKAERVRTPKTPTETVAQPVAA